MTLTVWLETAEAKLAVGRVGTTAGELLLEFTEEYLASGLDLSPARLPVATTPRLLRWPLRSPFGPLPGLLDDTMPDSWGIRVMDRQLASAGGRSPDLLQRLAWLGDTTMGAISYRPASRRIGDPIDVDLAATARAAGELITGAPEDVLETIARAGGSPGGARPKILIGLGPDGHLITGEAALPDGYEPWLVKFAAPGDDPYAAEIEYAYLEMADRAGIDVPQRRLLRGGDGRQHLAVRRFDRHTVAGHHQRVHVATASGILHASHVLPSTDYETLLRLTLRLTRDVRCAEQQLRRAAFNVFAHNRDDHTKNHSLMRRDGDWVLAPAYDLTASGGAGGEHALTVAGKGRGITPADIVSLGRDASVPQAQDSVDAVQAALHHWMDIAEHAGVPEQDAVRVKSLLAEPR